MLDERARGKMREMFMFYDPPPTRPTRRTEEISEACLARIYVGLESELWEEMFLCELSQNDSAA